jgi:malto-oligosyltrehalose trehalohydrolase
MNLHTTALRTVSREQEMKFGTQITASGVRFRLWAPQCEQVSVRLLDPAETLPMQKVQRGWFELEVEGVGPGTCYYYVMPDGSEVPDPASRFQPKDVDGPSEVIDPLAFSWSDVGWRGRPWEETILYELHVGTFTPEGTFRAAIQKLDHLVALGVTALELMPIADFAGRWNWGYDGALLFAPDSTYGRPDDLKALVEAAHQRELMVFLDVVYNHFGPVGNYMTVYAPAYTAEHHTPWGPAVNFDDEGSAMIRDFVIANARYWVNEYRFDGLRFDAVHEIRDSGPKHMLQDLAEQIRASTDGRHVHLVAENSANQAGWLKRADDGRPLFYTAQWTDDIHHALHTAATGESFWYYADFVNRRDLLARALAEGLGWQGEFMEQEGHNKGEPSAYLPATAFVSFIQNHDQIGNRPYGERLPSLVPERAYRMMAAILLLSPQIPLLFMGEDWAADQPFLFFSDIQHLGDSIRKARLEELKDAPQCGAEAPDPMSEATFQSCKLLWNDFEDEVSRRQLSLYRRLIDIRRTQIVPRLFGMAGDSARHEVVQDRGIRVTWRLGDGSELTLLANVSSEPLEGVPVDAADHLWVEGLVSGDTLHPWSVVFILNTD